MGPIVTEINENKTLTNPIIFNGVTISQIFVKELILRPMLKRIVFTSTELERTIIYDGDVEYETHKDDSQSVLISKLLEVIDTTYPHA